LSNTIRVRILVFFSRGDCIRNLWYIVCFFRGEL